MKIPFVLLWLSLLLICPAFAQEDGAGDKLFPDSENRLPDEDENPHSLVSPGDLGSTRAYQTETVARKNFDEEKWRSIVGGVNFNEIKKEKKEEVKDSESSAAPDFSIPWGGPVLRFVSYVVIVAIVILLVYFIIKNISQDLHIQRSKLDTNDLEKPVENIESVDVQTLLERASRDGNFKLAVRLYYLRLLKKLNEQGIISWKKDKTNREYLAELFARNFLFDEIRRLTLSYESVWYGDHSLQVEAFRALSDHFEDIHQRIDSV